MSSGNKISGEQSKEESAHESHTLHAHPALPAIQKNRINKWISDLPPDFLKQNDMPLLISLACDIDRAERLLKEMDRVSKSDDSTLTSLKEHLAVEKARITSTLTRLGLSGDFEKLDENENIEDLVAIAFKLKLTNQSKN
jgi:hypothetical protein